ncbi:hypothetical protein [Streptomyces thermodiastaticus]|uniref:hypothetical protein n=1 Tax=Streptomyces thermodiastaticus TaxID=44061 RepID=UPI00167C3766|nr:hypothetical protein [Streptomyces thermodiastaticus]MCE7552771.1 hypothetical protein [Streptomyces thermodiastaticus]GHF89029.1 hypothetical protein GCM10018787_42140 [Streptomyces thermodiastaticus]
MAYAIAALYAALLVETFSVASLAVRTIAPETEVKHGPRYRGVHTKAQYLYRLAAESGHTTN